jgi:hypothetical protein
VHCINCIQQISLNRALSIWWNLSGKPTTKNKKTKTFFFFQPRGVAEESSDDEIGSESPLDEVAVAPEFGGNSVAGSGVYPPSSLSLREHRTRHDSGTRSDTSYVQCQFV